MYYILNKGRQIHFMCKMNMNFEVLLTTIFNLENLIPKHSISNWILFYFIISSKVP
jgi:hypothetical protein